MKVIIMLLKMTKNEKIFLKDMPSRIEIIR